MADTTNPILAAAYSGAASTAAVVDKSTAGIQNDRTAQQTLQDNSASLQLDIGAQDNIIAGVQNQGALAAQNARLKAGAIFGADLNQQGEQITAATDIWKAAYQKKMDSLSAISQKDSVGFMDNPLGFILNQFSVNDDIRAHNSALEVEQAAKQHIDEINSMSDATARNQKNFEINITQASIDAVAKKTTDAAQILANKAETDGLGYNVDSLQTAIAASKETTALKFQVLGAQNAQAQLKIAMDSYALHKEEFDWRQEEKANKDLGDADLVDRMQRGLTVLYGDKAPDLTASKAISQRYLSLLKSNSPAGKEAVDAYMAGQTGIIGGSPAQVIDSINSGVAVQFTPVQEPIKRIFEVATQQVGSMPLANKQEAVKALNVAVTGQMDKFLKDIEPGSGNNPFNIGAVSSLVQMPGVNTTPLAQKVLAPMVTAGAKLDDPKQVYASALAAVSGGKISVEDAVDGIVTLYQKGVDTNLAARNFTKFGIVPSDNMHTYNTQIAINPDALFGGTSVVDLTNRNAVQRAILKTMSNQSINSTIDSLNPFKIGMEDARAQDGSSMIPKDRQASPHSLAGYN